MTRRRTVALVAGLSVAGAAAAIGLGTVAMASTPSPSPSSTARAHSNEDPSHEAGESAAQEQAEDSGQGWHGGQDRHAGHSNEDPSHEASESPQREAQENANSGSPQPAPTTSGTTGLSG
jgi:hypothetical protein